MSEDWETDYDAPKGAVWVCAACGKNGKNRVRIGDESCFLHAVLCHDDKPEGVSPKAHKWKAIE